MQFGQNNMFNRNMNNNSCNMPNLVNPSRNLANMTPPSNTRPISNNNRGANIAGINKMPQFDRNSRFKNVKMDRDPAKQIMNSAGQNMIQNKIRGVGDASVR